jgi:hypothetical protein
LKIWTFFRSPFSKQGLCHLPFVRIYPAWRNLGFRKPAQKMGIGRKTAQISRATVLRRIMNITLDENRNIH